MYEEKMPDVKPNLFDVCCRNKYQLSLSSIRGTHCKLQSQGMRRCQGAVEEALNPEIAISSAPGSAANSANTIG